MDGFILGFPCSLQAKMEIRGTNVITGLSFFFFSFSSFCGKREHSGSGFYSDFFLFSFRDNQPVQWRNFFPLAFLSLSLRFLHGRREGVVLFSLDNLEGTKDESLQFF